MAELSIDAWTALLLRHIKLFSNIPALNLSNEVEILMLQGKKLYSILPGVSMLHYLELPTVSVRPTCIAS